MVIPLTMRSINQPEAADRWLLATPQTMIVQPTSLCPLACTYCYLPERHRKQEMTIETARALAEGIGAEWGIGKPLEIVWHGGEPLAVGCARFRELLAPFEDLRAAGRVVHRIQTGATLINDEWCGLFKDYDIDVGVSLDGPRFVNRHRVDRAGREMFDRILRGIECLKAHDIGFTTLAVVTEDSIPHAEELLKFFAELGCSWIGLNVEGKEAANVDGQPPALEQARSFWRDVFRWSAANPTMTIREVRSLFGFLGLASEIQSADGLHDPIPTVGWNGDVILLSPELLGVRSAEYEDFVAGNVRRESIASIVGRAAEIGYVREFMDGLNECKRTCEFWNYCQGAHAGNRYFEHGNFRATETLHCLTSFQAPVLALGDLMREGANE
ncbi:putative arylsulfatase regulatory protein [Alloactinosynnema sp. L-07]|uniref:cyclophane-forming radical SAM peptide maturase AmcB n=1 Tax=Alloactinosynnema sp. L-07 TaxID=1653480 RepID=UPI00065F037C|nr:cyclophane-forming radical SAM peptide maturase AmcB [Alloactinosynnema sp. L-07]CRK60511.1 putative arylsulfatase regulatory protein [Alloactinosynnema sp. L-07]